MKKFVRKMYATGASFFLSCLLVLSVTACSSSIDSGGGESNIEEKKIVPVSDVVLSKESISGSAEDSFDVLATVYPENATDKSLIWYTESDMVLVSVDKNNSAKATIKIVSTEAGTCAVTVFTSNESVYASIPVIITKKENSSGQVDPYNPGGQVDPDNPGGQVDPKNPDNPGGQVDPDNPGGQVDPDNPEENIEYTLSFQTFTNGTVTTEKTSYKKGEIVEFTVTPDEDYKLSYLRYLNEYYSLIDIQKKADGKYQLEMPAYDISIYASFKSVYDPIEYVEFTESDLLIPTGETVNLGYTVTPETANYAISFVLADSYKYYTNGTIASVTETANPYVTISDTGAVTATKTGSGKLIFAKVTDKAYGGTKYFGPVKVTVKDLATSFKVYSSSINVKAGDQCPISYTMSGANYSSNVILKGLKVTNTCKSLKFNGLGNNLTTESSIEGDYDAGEIIIETDDFPTYKIPVCVYKDEIPEKITFDKEILVLKQNETYLPKVSISNVSDGVYTPEFVLGNDDVISLTDNTITAKKKGYGVIYATVGNINSEPLYVLVTDSDFVEEDDVYSIKYKYNNSLVSGKINGNTYTVTLENSDSEKLYVKTLPIITQKEGKKMIEVYVVAENSEDASVTDNISIESSLSWLGGGANMYVKDNKAVISVNGKPVKYTLSNISNNGIFSIDGENEVTNASFANTMDLPEIVWKNVTLEKGENKVFTFQIELEKLKERSLDVVIY